MKSRVVLVQYGVICLNDKYCAQKDKSNLLKRGHPH